MSTQENEQPNLGKITRAILLTALVFALPGLHWSLFGWLHLFLPLLAFYLLGVFGEYAGKRLLLIASGLTGIVFLFLQSFDLFLFTAALVISGYILYTSAKKGDEPYLSGFKGSAVLAFGWAVIMAVYSVGSEISAYGQLIGTLDEGIKEALDYYRGSSDISAETLVILEATLHRMQVVIPIIMPAVLGSLVMLLIWFTMITGNLLLQKAGQPRPWLEYQLWQLPDKLVWLTIGTGISALLPIPFLQTAGINFLILLSLVYCFQGMSVSVFFMNKWNVPLLLKSFFYAMIIFQSFGTILLLFVGIADTWFDFRKLKPGKDTQSNE